MKTILVIFMFLLTLPVWSQENSFGNMQHERELMKGVAQWIKGKNARLSDEHSLQIVKTVYRYSGERNLDPYLIFGIIKAESMYHPKAANSYGARGLMQVVPRWHRDKLAGRDALGIKTNIEVGTTIIDDCLKKHRDNLTRALSCYSGGAGQKYHDRIRKARGELRELTRAFKMLNAIPNQYTHNGPRQYRQEVLAFMK